MDVYVQKPLTHNIREVRRTDGLILWNGNALRPHRTVGPHMDGMHRADQALVEPLDHLLLRRIGGPLVAHLGHPLVFAGGLGKPTRLVESVPQGLVHGHIEARLQSLLQHAIDQAAGTAEPKPAE